MSRNTHFFMLPLGWHRDPVVSKLSALGVNVFIALVEYCQITGNRGVMTWEELASVARSFVRGRTVIDQLVCAEAVIVESVVGEESDSSWSVVGEERVIVRLSNAQRWLFTGNPRKAISAAGDGGVARNGDAALRARVKRDREIEREEERTPSGSVRSSSARAVPRSAGGAARPAPVAGCWQGATVDEDDFPPTPPMPAATAKEMARKAIRNGQRNSPHSTGKDVTFSRYDPDRKIVPLTSGFTIDGGAE